MTAAASPAAARARLVVGSVALAVYQAVLINGYHDFRTTWHYLVHSGIGFGLALSVAALVTARTGRRTRPVVFALAGQLVSVLPDVMFRFLRMPHVRGMDVFMGHVTIHVSPLPLIVAVVMALGGSWSWWLATSGRRSGGTALAAATGALLAAALAAHTPIPTRLSHFESRFGEAPAAARAQEHDQVVAVTPER